MAWKLPTCLEIVQERLNALEKSEWDHDFERLMRARLQIGALRHGKLGAANKPQFDRLGSIRKRLAKYEESGNTEMLVDIANLCLLEFVEGKHPKKHFDSSEGEHTKEI